jgi:hypothetical protein
MSDVITTFESDGDSFIIKHHQNEIPTLNANAVERMAKANGFTKKRLMRKVASIPSTAVRLAESMGYDMSDRNDVMKFLKRFPAYRTTR